MSNTEHQPNRELPEALPPGERILWQGAPNWPALAWRAFHVRDALAWFALIAAVRVVSATLAGTALVPAMGQAAALLPLCLLGCAILSGLAWLHARMTNYTVTDKRVVMRVGVALPLTVNIPLAEIAGAFAKLDGHGAGDVGLVLDGTARLPWIALWPHARPWCVRSPEPTMRALSDGARLANLLTDALAASAGGDKGAFVRQEIAVPPVRPALGASAPDGFGAAT